MHAYSSTHALLSCSLHVYKSFVFQKVHSVKDWHRHLLPLSPVFTRTSNVHLQTVNFVCRSYLCYRQFIWPMASINICHSPSRVMHALESFHEWLFRSAQVYFIQRYVMKRVAT